MEEMAGGQFYLGVEIESQAISAALQSSTGKQAAWLVLGDGHADHFGVLILHPDVSRNAFEEAYHRSFPALSLSQLSVESVWGLGLHGKCSMNIPPIHHSRLAGGLEPRLRCTGRDQADPLGERISLHFGLRL